MSPRERQIAQAQEDALTLEVVMAALDRGLWMPWATLDEDGDVVLFATEALADAYVDEIHGGDRQFAASQVPIRFE